MAQMNQHAHIASVIAAYWFVSISMVYLNKMLMSSESVSIPAPLFITWFQCVVTVVICKVLGNIGEVNRKNATASFFTQFPVVDYHRNVGMQVAPLSIIFVGMISFNNICLKFVEVSFYNVARSLSIVFNVSFTYLILEKVTSIQTAACLLIVILGFLVGIDGELNFSVFGTACGVMSSIFVSLNSIYTARVLPNVDGDKSKLLYYNNFNAAMLFIPLVLVFESSILMEHFYQLRSLIFWMCMIVTGCMGFAIGLVTVMQIKATSPLTHNISGTAKAAFQSFLAFYIWGNAMSLKGIMGIILVVFGSGLYTYVQMKSKPQQMKKEDTGRNTSSPDKV
jgi:solute carrier family 35 (GDP-fucose transporter), member C1